jgi:peptide/nickel transport system substrate-binding protein
MLDLTVARLGRRAALVGLGGGAVALAAACAPAAPAPTAKPAASAAAPTAAGAAPAASPKPAASAVASPAAAPAANIRPGGTLRAAQIGDVSSLLPHSTGIQTDTMWQIFDRLTWYDDNVVAQPGLAESWDISPDQKTMKFNLRKGVTFHNGREFTSEDVKRNLNWAANEPKTAGTSPSITAQAKYFTTVQTPDKNTIVLGMDVARPGIFDAFEFLNIADPAFTEGKTGAPSVVGTGPFQLAEYEQGVRMRLVKNKNYWMTGRPYFDEVTVQIMPDAQAMVAQLEAGALDLVDRAPIRDLLRLKETGRYDALVSTANINIVYQNVKYAPLANKLVRQALSYALDRKRFAQTTYSGLAQPRAIPFAPGAPAYDEAKANAQAFDLDKAKALMAQAGSTGFDIDMIWNASLTDLRTLAELYQADLAKIGIKATPKPMEPAAFLDTSTNVTFNGIALSTAPGVDLSTAKTLELRAFNQASNGSAYTSPAWSQLVSQVQVEVDPAKQKTLYTQVNDFMLDECFTMTVCGNAAINSLFASKVKGVRFTKFTGLSYTNAGFSA